MRNFKQLANSLSFALADKRKLVQLILLLANKIAPECILL